MTWVNISGMWLRFPSYEALVAYLSRGRKAGNQLRVWCVEQKGWAK